MNGSIDVGGLREFLRDVNEVAQKRDLGTATVFGGHLNRIVSQVDRHADELSPRQRALVELAHAHIQTMMNCPRRMRLDNTWQDDFVAEATKAAELLLSAAQLPT